MGKLREFASAGLPVLLCSVRSTPPGLSATPLSEGGCATQQAPSERGLSLEATGGVLRAVSLSALADAVRGIGGADVSVEGDFPLLRIYHVVRDGNDLFMLFNESPGKCAMTVRLPARGPFARLRLLEDFAASDTTADGAVAIDLLPGQSEILVFGSEAGLSPAPRHGEPVEIHPVFSVSVADSDDLSSFRHYAVTDKLFNLAAPDRIPDFAGKARYAFALEVAEKDLGKAVALDLGRVGQTARLFVNGSDVGIRIAPPYRFEIGNLLHAGANAIIVETADTLARKVRDRFSFFMQLPPSGLLGPLRMLLGAE